MSSYGNLWKILTCAAIATGSSIILFLPRQPRASDLRLVKPVANESRALAKIKAPVRPDEFAALARQALERSPWAFGALRDIAKENKIALADFFPAYKMKEADRSISFENDECLWDLLRQAYIDAMATIEIEPDELSGLSATERAEKLKEAEEIIRNRLYLSGVENSYMIIGQTGDGSLMVVVLYANNIDLADTLQRQWRGLEFRLVHPYITPADAAEIPIGYEPKALYDGVSHIESLYVKRRPEADYKILSRAFVTQDEVGRPEIAMQFTPEGRNKFTQITRGIVEETASLGQQLGRQLPPGRLAIILDGRIYSAPTVREEISTDSARITGHFSMREARYLAATLNNPINNPIRMRVTDLREVTVPDSVFELVSGPLRIALYAIMIAAALMTAWFVIVAARNVRRAGTPPQIPPPSSFQP